MLWGLLTVIKEGLNQLTSKEGQTDMTSYSFHLISRNGAVIDTDDMVMTDAELSSELSALNAALVRIAGADAWEVDMADGSRGFVRVVGVEA